MQAPKYIYAAAPDDDDEPTYSVAVPNDDEEEAEPTYASEPVIVKQKSHIHLRTEDDLYDCNAEDAEEEEEPTYASEPVVEVVKRKSHIHLRTEDDLYDCNAEDVEVSPRRTPPPVPKFSKPNKTTKLTKNDTSNNGTEPKPFERQNTQAAALQTRFSQLRLDLREVNAKVKEVARHSVEVEDSESLMGIDASQHEYISVKDTPAVITPHTCPWFHGAISRGESEKRLHKYSRSSHPSTWLVREKEAGKSYVISVVFRKDRGMMVEHHMLSHVSDAEWLVNDNVHFKGKDGVADVLHELQTDCDSSAAVSGRDGILLQHLCPNEFNTTK